MQNNSWMAVYQRLRYMFFMGVQETETISFVFSLCFSYMVYFAKKIPHSMIIFLPFIKDRDFIHLVDTEIWSIIEHPSPNLTPKSLKGRWFNCEKYLTDAHNDLGNYTVPQAVKLCHIAIMQKWWMFSMYVNVHFPLTIEKYCLTK